MADKLDFELVSPEKLLITRAVDMVVVPGGEGDFGVLIGHAPLISTMRPGVIDIYENERITERMFVFGGFVEVTETRCIVLAEKAIPLTELDRVAIEKSLKDLGEDLEDAKTDGERAEIEEKLVVARAMLEAANAPPIAASTAH